jgi:receptor protein-tyrosine kinase
LLVSNELAGRVIDDLHLDMTPKELVDEITANAVQDTVLIDVTVTDRSPQRARDIAAAVGTEFQGMVRGLETAPGATGSPVRVTVADHPEIPQVPSAPKPVRNLALGLFGGLLLGAGLAIARATMDRTVHDQSEAAELVGAPLIGVILRDDQFAQVHAIDRAGSSPVVEEYRQLRTNLQFLSVDDPPRVMMVTSALPGEGKTTLAINLALALGEADHRVALVEADLRRPRVTRYLGLVEGAGLSNVLSGGAELEDVAQTYGGMGLSVLAAGPKPPNPGELLASAHMTALLDKLRGKHDFVIIDAPPLLPVADGSGLAPSVDGVVLSVRYGSTRKEQLRQAAQTLDGVHATTLGVVLNIVPLRAEVAAAYGYGYRYEPGRHQKG